MSVDTFWKRLPTALFVERVNASDLLSLFPLWFDDDFDNQRDTGLLVAAVDTGALVKRLVQLGASGTADEPVSLVFAQPEIWLDDQMAGGFGPERVQQIASFLEYAPVEAWMEQHHDKMSDYAIRLNRRLPLDNELEEDIVDVIRNLRGLFLDASASYESIVERLSA